MVNQGTATHVHTELTFGLNVSFYIRLKLGGVPCRRLALHELLFAPLLRRECFIQNACSRRLSFSLRDSHCCSSVIGTMGTLKGLDADIVGVQDDEE